MTIRYIVSYDSGAEEEIEVTGRTYTACIASALQAAKRYDQRTGKRDHVISIAFAERTDDFGTSVREIAMREVEAGN